MPTRNKGTLFDGVAVLAGGHVIVEATTVTLRKDKAKWAGVLSLALDELNMAEAGDLQIWLPNGRSGRFAIVGSLGQTSVEIRGFGPPPF